MNILIAGGTGLIGKALVEALVKEKHKLTVLSRDKDKVSTCFGASVQPALWDELSQLDPNEFNVVINLSGYNIAQSRWRDAIKKKLIDSRVKTNLKLIDWMGQSQTKPRFFSANAIGIYGAQTESDKGELDENTPFRHAKPIDFLNEIGTRWHDAAVHAKQFNIPLTITRFGVVLKRGEGMLKQLTPAFLFGLGSVIGPGKQVISWVDIDDVVRAYQFLLEHPELDGDINISSPHPVTQAEFAQSLASTLKRPLFLKTPQWVIRLLFGEMGEYLINRGQRVVPKKLLTAGFQFKYAKLEDALVKELKNIR